MFAPFSARGQAIVTPLPPNSKKVDTNSRNKIACNPESNDDVIRDDLPLLKPHISSEKESKSVGVEKLTDGALPKSSGGWCLDKLGGLGCIIIAAFLFSIVSVCVKYASRFAKSNILVFWRMVIGLAMSCLWIHFNKTDMFVGQKDRFLLFFRCLMGSLGTTMAFYAMSNMPLTDAIVIIFTSPIFTFFLAAVVLGEAIDYVDLFGGLTSFVGVLFVTRPAILFPTQSSGSSPPMLAIICAVGSSLSQATIYISMRKMKDVASVLVTHYFLMFGAFYSTFMLWALGVEFELPTDPRFLVSIISCAFFSLLGQWFLTKGFQTVKAGIASVMRYFDVVFVMCLDALVLGESINLYSMIGAAIIISGASVIVMRQTVAKK